MAHLGISFDKHYAATGDVRFKARADYIGAHLRALACAGRKFAGQSVGFVDEVEAYFDVQITKGDPDRYREAHVRLDEALGGTGPLAERMQANRSAEEIPPERLEESIDAFSSALRDRVRLEFPLPDSETIDYEVVTDKPWSGFNYYLGDYRSTVAVNADLRQQMSNLPRLVAHESYPGHHTEHCRKEAGLVAKHGHTEQTLFLVNTPQCLMAEGWRTSRSTSRSVRKWGGWATEIYADLGLRFDGERAEAVSEAAAALADVRQDAALMLHDEHLDVDDVVAFLRRWLLVNDERARQMLRFLSSPLWRAYTSTYVEGYRLLRAWLTGARPGSASPSGSAGCSTAAHPRPCERPDRRLCGFRAARRPPHETAHSAELQDYPERMTADSTATTSAAPGAEYADTASAAYRDILQIIESSSRASPLRRAKSLPINGIRQADRQRELRPPAVLLTMGTWLSDKYAEGTIGHRSMPAAERRHRRDGGRRTRRAAVGSPHAYVQPHSGIDANLVAYRAILATRVEAPGWPRRATRQRPVQADWEELRGKLGNQRLMGMSRCGRPPHPRLRPNISGKMFHQRSYGTDPETGLLDYDALAQAAREFKPLVLPAGTPPTHGGSTSRNCGDRRRGRCDADGGHGPFRGSGGRQGVHR